MAEQKELEEAPAKVSSKILSEQEYERLVKLYQSPRENWAIANEILISIDREANIFYIWQIAKRFYNVALNLRIKKHRHFRDDINFCALAHLGNNGFAQYLEKKGWLTPERFQILYKDIIDKTIRSVSLKHSFYELKLSYELKPEYKHLDPTDKQQTV
jgi:hypothetical protein